jgi:hypothetical protein
MLVGEKVYGDLLGGGGILVNDNFRSYFLQGLVGASYAVTDAFNIGPHGGVLWFIDPQWDNDAVEFDGAVGWMLGVQMTLGDRVKYVMSVDFLSASLDATAAAGASIDGGKDKLDIEGLAIQFGVRGEF